MVRQIITPESTQLTVNIPSEYIGHKVEVIAFRIEENNKPQDKYSWENALKFFNSHRVSLKNYKFNREEANER